MLAGPTSKYADGTEHQPGFAPRADRALAHRVIPVLGIVGRTQAVHGADDQTLDVLGDGSRA